MLTLINMHSHSRAHFSLQPAMSQQSMMSPVVIKKTALFAETPIRQVCCTYLYIYTFISISMCLHLCVYIYVSTSTSVCLDSHHGTLVMHTNNLHTCTEVYMHLCKCMSACICIDVDRERKREREGASGREGTEREIANSLSYI
jgi:hypothetical protein